jgi:hypothetical protein
MRGFAVSMLLIFSVLGGSARDLTRYVLVLNDPPASAAGTRAAIAAARLRNIEAHAPVRSWLEARNFPITAETHVLLNAIYVASDTARAAQLRTAPGVRYVARVPRYHRSLDRAIQLINVPAAWNAQGGASHAGAGIRIAIIDTGIESTHAAFQDASLTPPRRFSGMQHRAASFRRARLHAVHEQQDHRVAQLCADDRGGLWRGSGRHVAARRLHAARSCRPRHGGRNGGRR